MPDKPISPDNTAIRVALWRALHLEVDAPPHVFQDAVGLQLAAPADDWRSRPDVTNPTAKARGLLPLAENR